MMIPVAYIPGIILSSILITFGLYLIIQNSKKPETIEINHAMSAQEAVDILCNELLGTDYYITDSVNLAQANSIIVKDIVRKYAFKNVKRVYKEATE